MKVQGLLREVLERFSGKGISSFLVGGLVRDHLLGIESDDIDICLVGVSDSDLVEEVLREFNISVASEVGGAFPVWIADIPGAGKVDFALARTEKKSGQSRKEFLVSSQGVSIEEDLLRRDLTINAIAMDALTGSIVDPFKGREHLANRVAHPVSEAFAEDTLRVLRAARFCARFGLNPSEELVGLCQRLTPVDISRERVGMELWKASKQSQSFGTFFKFLNEVNWLGFHFAPLQSVIEDHGDTWLDCLNQAQSPLVRIALTVYHLSEDEARSMLQAIKLVSGDFIKEVVALANVAKNLKDREGFIGALRGFTKVCSHGDAVFLVSELAHLVSGDGDWQEWITVNLDPIVTGKLLLSLGFVPGKDMGIKLNHFLRLQDQGLLTQDNFHQFLNR